MVGVLEITLLLLVWHTFGALILSFGPVNSLFNMAKGMEFVNPIFIYKHSKVNWFGAIMLMIFYSIFLPIGTVAYWFYKLCTVGRKELED